MYTQRAPRPVPATAETPDQKCIQCVGSIRRLALIGQVNCGRCKRVCLKCKIELRYGHRNDCYDCLWAAASPDCPPCTTCGMPAENGGKLTGTHICGACYKNKAYYEKKRKLEEYAAYVAQEANKKQKTVEALPSQ